MAAPRSFPRCSRRRPTATSRSRSSLPVNWCPACRSRTPPPPAPSRPAIRWHTIIGARTRHGLWVPRFRSRSTRAASMPGITTAAASTCSTSFWPRRAFLACRVAIPACRWAAGSARKSTLSPTFRASRCASVALPAKWCKGSASCRSRSPAAISIQRWKKAPSTPPNGSALMTMRSSASTRSRPIIIIPAGGKAGRPSI